jgi:uncharacterized protein YndB with AHSA1/START domain
MQTLEIKRTINAPRQLVWDHWTVPELISEWWGPEGLHTPLESITCELHVGGRFALKMVVDADGTEHGLDGVFETLDPPSQMVIVSATSESDFSISVTFDDLGGDKTEITLFSTGTATDEEIASMDAGWNDMYDKLSKLLAK